MKPHPRPPISPRLRLRLRALEACLMEAWGEYEGVEPYSEQGRVLTMRLHELHLAIAETLQAIDGHRNKRRVWTKGG